MAVFFISENSTVKAPELPTTETLEKQNQLSARALADIDITRQFVDGIVRNPSLGLIAIVGACALTDNLRQLQCEASELQELELETPGLVPLQRLNTWKPRSLSTSWFGMETTDTTRAYEIVASQAAQYGNAAMELGYIEHIDRYAPLVALGWLGARNEGDGVLLEHAARQTHLPIGVKNGESGEINEALQRIERIHRIRGESGAAAVLLYRGGKNALTPIEWEANYQRAHDATNGQLIVDLAHGAMRAHNIGGGKGMEGQLRARDHLLELAARGYMPAGIMMEASETESVVDPNAPHHEALFTIKALTKIKAGLYVPTR